MDWKPGEPWVFEVVSASEDRLAAGRAMVERAGPWIKGWRPTTRYGTPTTYLERGVDLGLDPDTDQPVTTVERLLALRAECDAMWKPKADTPLIVDPR